MPSTPWKDYQLAYINEAITLGADAIAMAIGVIGDYQGEEIAMLSNLVNEASIFGLPVIGYIYPKGNTAKPEDFYDLKYVKYAAHVGSEIGLDIIKVPYTGSIDSFAVVVESCTTKVVAAGGQKINSITKVLEMANEIIEAGAAGITFGRNVWQDDHITAIIAALKAIVHERDSVKKALKIYNELSKINY
jgi:DhnA family fructose-bisphosphate aldolase class Ia